MADTEQKSLLLILCRELASNLATPVFVVDSEGTLVFYNEAAEQILGVAFDEVGERSRDEWATMFSPRSLDGRELDPEELPLAVALVRQRPEHMRLSITGRDGVDRTIAVTAFPLLASTDKVAGAVAIFWEDGAAGRASPGSEG